MRFNIIFGIKIEVGNFKFSSQSSNYFLLLFAYKAHDKFGKNFRTQFVCFLLNQTIFHVIKR